jgi:hypothetical protein
VITYRVEPADDDSIAVEIVPKLDADKGPGAWVSVTDDENPHLSAWLNKREVTELREVLEKVSTALEPETA